MAPQREVGGLFPGGGGYQYSQHMLIGVRDESLVWGDSRRFWAIFWSFGPPMRIVLKEEIQNCQNDIDNLAG